jgi:sugar lactone lactonase YvrE
MRIQLQAAAILAALVVAGMWARSPIAPVAWSPTPEAPWMPLVVGPVTLMPLDGATGGEDVAPLGGRALVTGVADGRLLSWDGERWTELARTGGRPLGIAPASDGGLWVADGHLGLLHVDAAGVIQVRAASAGGAPLRLADDVDEAPNGTVWLSDASARFDLPEWKLDVLEGTCTGRLISVAPGATEGQVRLDGLCFANGVAVAPDGSYVLVAETSRYRVRRLWLSGARAGQHELLVEGLPGFPDGVSVDVDGNAWVALASSRRAIVDALAPWPAARAVLASLPEALLPQPARVLRVAVVSPDGRIRGVLVADESPPIFTITSAEVVGSRLLLGSLVADRVGWMSLPVIP